MPRRAGKIATRNISRVRLYLHACTARLAVTYGCTPMVKTALPA
ncbi:hypothetical protein SAMN00790413_04118 [Deinococcus hopiensis KR-140]|uniref:Uncharacterized protein n=1 Tax=Deinococcus hopiensis KR-140 TaxID=695939 RepID=A0A1W1UNX1_9DEIO|nr:hypothetical protein SAMN00790413_04118 [Deinococcus hopiensis KR-140]